MTVHSLAEIQAAVTAWDKANRAKDAAVLKERELRDVLVNMAFPNVEEGAGNKTDIGHGTVLQVTGVISRKIDIAVFDSLKHKVPADVLDAVIKNKPELIVGAWKTLPASSKKLLAPAVEEKPGTHQVKLVPKKPGK